MLFDPPKKILYAWQTAQHVLIPFNDNSPLSRRIELSARFYGQLLRIASFSLLAPPTASWVYRFSTKVQQVKCLPLPCPAHVRNPTLAAAKAGVGTNVAAAKTFVGSLGFFLAVSNTPPHIGDAAVISRDRLGQQRPNEDVDTAHAPAVALQHVARRPQFVPAPVDILACFAGLKAAARRGEAVQRDLAALCARRRRCRRVGRHRFQAASRRS